MGGAGDLAADRFEIQHRLGSGGMGSVFLAVDHRHKSLVALKSLTRVDGAALYRFKREFRSLEGVRHPNLVSLYELHTAGDEWFFTMELVDGVPFSLYVRPQPPPGASGAAGAGADSSSKSAKPAKGSALRKLVRSGVCNESRLRDALVQLTDAVYTLHAIGRIHRDLKPTNVLVEPDGRVVVLDFGLVGEADAAHADKTHESVAVGTPMYMSPEQAADVPLSEASDWYSVGVMLYEALTGVRPFELGRAGESVLLCKQLEDPTPPAELAPEAPPDLLELCARLLSRNPNQRPDGGAILRALGRGPSRATLAVASRTEVRPFVGRRAELDALRAVYGTRVHGPSIALITGPAGIGKSSLVRAFLAELPESDRPVVLAARCIERESVPHKALDPLIDSLSRFLLGLEDDEREELLPSDIDALVRMFPVLERVPGMPRPALIARRDPQDLRRKAMTTLRELFSRITAQRSLVLYIDDIQYGDTESSDFLSQLISEANAGTVIVLSYRDDARPDIVTHLENLARTIPSRSRRLVLGGLENQEAAALLTAITGQHSTEGHELIMREAAGDPMLLVELGRQHDRSGDHAFESLIRARHAQLESPERTLVRVCAVAQQPLPWDIALRAAGGPGEEEHIVALRAKRMLRSRSVAGEPCLEVYHSRIGEIIAAEVAATEQRAVHRDIASAYEARDRKSAEVLEALIEHWMRAGAREHVARYARRAASVAESRFTFHRAADYYALVMENSSSSLLERKEILRRWGDALTNAGRLDEAAEVYSRAAAEASGRERLMLRRLEVEQLLRRGRLDVGRAKAEELLAELGVQLPRTPTGALVGIAFNRARLRLRGLERAPEALEHISREDLDELETTWSMASSLGMIDPLTARALQTRFVRRAVQVGESRNMARALASECGFVSLFGESKRALAETLHDRALEIANRLDDDKLRGIVEAALGYSYMAFGRWRESVEQLTRAVRILLLDPTELRWHLDSVIIMRSVGTMFMGRIAELSERVPEWLREADERGDRLFRRGVQGTRGNTVWLAANDPAEARARIDEVRTRSKGFHVHHFYELITDLHIDLYEDDPGAAMERLDVVWRRLTLGTLLRVEMVRVEAWSARARAAVRAAETPARRDKMCALAATAAKRLAREKAVWAAPLAAAARAGVAKLQGRQERALAELTAAASGFDEANMLVHADIARLYAGELSGDRDAVEEASQRLGEQTIVEPRRFGRIWIPGFA